MSGWKSGIASAALALATAATVARGVRLPNSFARAHWLFDYRFGFMKRALPGAALHLLARLGLLHLRRNTIFAVAIVVFIVLCATLLTMTVRTLSRDRWRFTTFLALAAFLTSPYMLTAAHLMGYLDHLVAILTFAAVWCGVRGRYWTAGLVAMGAVLVHETVFVTGIPVLLLAIAGRPSAPRGRALLNALVPMALPLAAGLAIVMSEHSLAQRMALRAQLVRRLSVFPWITGDMNIFVPEWVTTRAVDHLQEQAHAFGARIVDPGFLLDVAPTILALWLLASALSGWRRGWMAAAGAVIVAPLVLHGVAWDTAREWTYPLIVAFTCVWLASETGGGEAAWGPLSRRITAGLALVAIGVNIFMRYPLLDGEVDRFTNAERLLLYAPFAVGAVLVFGYGRTARNVAARVAKS
jgi:hypothetical protein